MKICEMVKPEIDYILDNANFTEDEKKVFVLLSKGCTRVQIADRTMFSIATIGRIKQRIETKIRKLQ